MLLHFSDTHLGHQRFSRTDPRTGLNQREQDVYDAFNHVIDAAIANPPDVVIHSGDLFDGVRPSNRALATALQGFVRLDRAGIQTVVIAGNHEHPRMLETGSPMRLFEHLDNVHPVYKGKAETIKSELGPIHAVPQCPDNPALRKEVESLPNEGILVMHGGVLGQDAFHHAEFNELTIDPAWFTGDCAERFDYVALGHFHGCTEIDERAWYAGATERMSMRESGEEKGFLRFDGQRVTFEEIPARPFVDLPTIHGDGLGSEALVDACLKSLQSAPDGSVVRLQANDIAEDLRGSLDTAAVREAGRRFLDLDFRPTFRAGQNQHATGARLGTLQEEFAAFVATYPMEGMDRKHLLALAQQALEAP